MSTEAHVRIDEGIKRPKHAHKPPKHRRKADLGSWVIPADLNPQEVLERYLAANTTSHIAQQYGVSRKALTQWMRKVAPEQWKAVQVIRALMNQEDAEEGIVGATDALALARARELLKSAQFNLQALDRDYQPKQQAETVRPVQININLRHRSNGQIDAEQHEVIVESPK